MADEAPLINASVCPLCGKANQCAMELEKLTGQAQGPCWCVGVDFGADLLARVPAQAQRLACICAACAHQNANLHKNALSG